MFFLLLLCPTACNYMYINSECIYSKTPAVIRSEKGRVLNASEDSQTRLTLINL